MAAHVGAVHGAGDPLRLVRGHLEEQEVLEQAHVADRLAVEPGRGDGRDHIAGLQACGAPARGDDRAVAAVGGDRLVVRLAMPARLGLLQLGRRDVGALGPGRDLGVGVRLDRREVARLARLDERDRPPAAADAARAADAVHVDVRGRRDVEVDDVRDGRDVEAARRDVGRDEDLHPLVLEGDHHAVAPALGHVAVERLHVHPAIAERAVELLAADLRAHEDDRLVGPLGLEHAGEHLVLLGRLDLDEELLDRVDGQRGGLDLDGDRVVEVALGEAADLVRHRRAEQRGLPAARRVGEDLLDVLEEAEVEHLVGLVEDEVAARVQDEGMARDQVEHAPDRPDDDLCARLSCACWVRMGAPPKTATGSMPRYLP